nr:Os06g0176125 [Ipomoea batatas]
MSSSWEDVGVAVASMVLATFSMFDKPENVFLITFTGAPCFPISAIASPNSPTVEANFFFPEVAAAISAGFDILGSTVPLPNDPALFSSLTRFLASSALQPTMVGMNNHVKNIVSLRNIIHNKMPSSLPNVLPHRYIPVFGHSQQDLLQLRQLLDGNRDRELVPIQDVAERQDVMLRDQNGNALRVDRLHDSRTGHLKPAGTQAKLALPYHVLVRCPLRHLLVHFNVFVFSSPVSKERGPYAPVQSACEEC